MFHHISLLMLAVCLLLQTKGIHGGIRSAVKTQAQKSSRSAITPQDEAGETAGMTRETFVMKDKTWELQPVDYTFIDDLQLRRHCQKFLSNPVQMKLSTRNGKFGLRAQGQLQSGKRLRGFWRQLTPQQRQQKGGDLLKMSYDDAVKLRQTTIEFEVQLPPINKKSRKLPSVIYSLAVETGAMNPKAIVPRGACNVRVLPDGHNDNDEEIGVLNAGKAYVSLPMKSGIVDPGWAKGRQIFRKGRPTGTV